MINKCLNLDPLFSVSFLNVGVGVALHCPNQSLQSTANLIKAENGLDYFARQTDSVNSSRVDRRLGKIIQKINA